MNSKAKVWEKKKKGLKKHNLLLGAFARKPQMNGQLCEHSKAFHSI